MFLVATSSSEFLMVRSRWSKWVTALALTTSSFAVFSFTRADDEKPAAAEAKESAAEEEDKPKAEALVIPEGNDSKALKLYLTKMMRKGPAAQNPKAIRAFLDSVRVAGEEILKREIDDEELQQQAASVQIQALEAMERFGDDTAADKLEALKKALATDKRPGVAALIEVSAFEGRVQAFEEAEPAEQKKIVAELAEKLTAPKLVPDYVQLTRYVGSMYESLDKPEEAKAALTLFADKLEARKDEDPQIQKMIKQMVGSLRGTAKRLDLIGRPIAIVGTDLEGKPFNIESWKGKVVLVDFWATWCGPCIGELPNVIKHYKAYHDKGFEIVGISLDEDVDQLKEFIAERKMNWTNLIDEKPENQGWSNPIARQYGISGIPACILVNQDGNVVSLNARGEKLGELLTKLLGPVDAPAEEEKPAKSE
jgi:thiol-disulfide isomerase/thioredoxin